MATTEKSLVDCHVHLAALPDGVRVRLRIGSAEPHVRYWLSSVALENTSMNEPPRWILPVSPPQVGAWSTQVCPAGQSALPQHDAPETLHVPPGMLPALPMHHQLSSWNSSSKSESGCR
mgnify:CR=1 FL=1